MGQTLATLSPLLKEVYEGGLNSQLNGDAKAYNRIKTNSKASQRFGGKYVNFPLHVARNSGIGSRNENEPLPVAGFQDTREATIPMKSHYAAVEITGQAIELADKDYQTFAETLDLEVSGIKNDVAKEKNRQFFGNGSGIRAVVTAVSGQNITVSTAKAMDLNGVYDVQVAATAVPRQQGLMVTNVQGNVLTVVGATTGIAVGDSFVRTGSYGREWTGIGAIVSDTSVLQGINPADVPLWKSVVVNNGNTATNVSELMFTRMADKIYENGGKTSVIFTTLGVQRAWFAMLQSQRRFVNSKEAKGGFSGVSFESASQGDITLVSDIDAPAGTAIFLDEKALTIYSNGGYKFMNRSGSMWSQKRTNAGTFDAWQATLYEYSEMGTNRRNTHGIITNITEDVSL